MVDSHIGTNPTLWLTFLRMIEEQTPKDKVLHLIVDNYATHKHLKV